MLKPLPSTRWDFTTAAHLLNRAGFCGTPAEIEKFVALGPEQSVSHFVDYEKIQDNTRDPDWAKPDPDRVERFMAARSAPEEERKKMQRQEQQTQRQHMLELKRWWLERMASEPRPSQEKMVLFWHGHFATSMEKVRDAYLMWRQNELFRRQATGNWLELLIDVAKDPAMLLWLDQAQSRKEHPNENFAREVMELFTLGEGQYTELDVTEAARALTGWSFDRMDQQFVYRPRMHDEGIKTVLGQAGNWKGEDVLEFIVRQPEADRFIAAKLWTFFASENLSAELLTALASEFRHAGQNFKPLLRRIFLSEEFYAESVM